jgi:ribosomal protein S18 acetylase RimI-like enzyme
MKNVEMKIRAATKQDYSKIARIHSETIPTGFISKLGIPFLTKLYTAIQEEKGSVVYVSESADNIIGFISGTINTNKLYRNVLMKKWYFFIIPLIRFILNPVSFFKIIETVRYGFHQKKNKQCRVIQAELLSIAVDKKARNQGIGHSLYNELEQFYKSCGVEEYKVVTFSENDEANHFYLSHGFTLFRQFIHHHNVMNEYAKSMK